MRRLHRLTPPIRSCVLVFALLLASCTPIRAPAADPEWLVFASARSGDGDIYALNPATGSLRVVVGTAAPEGTVRYDPARNRLVHYRFDDDRAVLVSDGRDLFVWLLDPASGETTRMTNDPAPDGGPLFVPESALRLPDDVELPTPPPVDAGRSAPHLDASNRGEPQGGRTPWRSNTG